jgi:hypothetical protein
MKPKKIKQLILNKEITARLCRKNVKGGCAKSITCGNADVFYKRINFWVLLLGVVLIVLGFLSLRPIINPTEEDCSRIVGTLEKRRFLSESRDIQFKIRENDFNVYYLNHVFDHEIKCSALDSLIGKKIVIYSVNHWTLLDTKRKYKHVARITNEDESMIIYSEY